MKKILVSAYAVNPYKGSEDGTGWNIVNQIAQTNKLIVITRENNEADITKFILESGKSHFKNIEFAYFDLPYWMRFWKRGSRGSQLYYLLWQIGLVFFIWRKKWDFDIAHHLNFHCDWLPSFLWLLGKPFVWGPVGHHPKIPKDFVLNFYGKKEYFLDRLKWLIKNYFWKVSPFFKTTISKADAVIGINSSVGNQINLSAQKMRVIPAVASKPVELKRAESDVFNVLAIGRFVPIKGFDVSIRAFAQFYNKLDEAAKTKVKFTIIGKGPYKNQLKELAKNEGCEQAIDFVEWMPREELKHVYRTTDLFLFTSHEGAGMVVPEAMSYGIPVLCFDNCGPGEFIDENSGVKIPYGKYDETVSAFANKLSRAFRDKNWLDKLSQGAKAEHANSLTWTVKGQQINEVYKKVKAA